MLNILGFQEIVPSKFERTAGLRELTPAEPYPKPQPESQLFCGNMMEGGGGPMLVLLCNGEKKQLKRTKKTRSVNEENSPCLTYVAASPLNQRVDKAIRTFEQMRIFCPDTFIYSVTEVCSFFWEDAFPGFTSFVFFKFAVAIFYNPSIIHRYEGIFTAIGIEPFDRIARVAFFKYISPEQIFIVMWRFHTWMNLWIYSPAFRDKPVDCFFVVAFLRVS